MAEIVHPTIKGLLAISLAQFSIAHHEQRFHDSIDLQEHLLTYTPFRWLVPRDL